MGKEIYLKRIQKTQEEMKKRGVDSFALGVSTNLQYLTGYSVRGDERLLLLVLGVDKEPFIIANLLYKAQVETIPVKDFVYWEDHEDPFAILKGELQKRGFRFAKVALESQLPALFSVPIAQAFPKAEFVLGDPLTRDLRQYKDAEELRLIRHACQEADKALGSLIDRGSYWLGKREIDFMEDLAATLRKAEVLSYGAIVAVGANGAVPHHVTGNTIIERGKGLLIDFGGRYQGYHTDATRTFHFGKADPEFVKVYQIVLDAHLAAEEKARLGNTLGDVDAAARTVIEKAGYGEYFTHRTGHGLGLDGHEGASASKGETTPLAPGMVFSIEPGIYLPGKLGVRIENLVAIGETETEIFHHYPRELRIID